MSISKSQAAALADGFLDDIGSDDKSELQPRETFTELFLLAGELVEDAQENLKANTASGGLSKSLEVTNPQQNGNVVSCDVVMDFYGQFLNKGVKGTKSGTGQYSFRSEFPSRKMVAALAKGIGRAKSSTTNVRRTVSQNEVKNKNLSQIEKAYGAGRNIKMYGIKATNFMDKAILTTEQKIEQRLGAAFKTDILNSLPDGDFNSANTGNI